MTVEGWIVLFLVLAVFAGFVREKFAPDMIAMSALALLLALGILNKDEAFSVFSNGAPITIAAMFVLSAALERTGVLDVLGKQLIRIASKSYLLALVSVMVLVMFVSAFMNNTPVVVVLTPVVIAMARQVGVSSSKMLMPLSFAAIFGGATTMIGTSTNLLVNGVAIEKGVPAFGMFEITLPGLALAGVGFVYLLIVGRFLMPERTSVSSILDKERRPFLAQALISQDSTLIGKTVEDANLERQNCQVLDVIRLGQSLRYGIANVTLRAGDLLVLEARAGEMLALKEGGQVEFVRPEDRTFEPVSAEETVVVEGIVGPESYLVGRLASRLNLRRLYGVYIMAIQRNDENYRANNFENVRITYGDTLLIEGPADGIRRLLDDGVLISLTHPQERAVRRAHAPIAIAAVIAVMGLAALNVMPIASLALIAMFAVVMFGCLDADEVYKAIEWRLLFLIFGMLGLSIAMEKTGVASQIVDLVMSFVESYGPLAVLAVLYLLTNILTEMVSNNAVAVLMAPIAIGVADQMGLDSRPFLVAIMFAASASFSTPIGYQTNTFIYNAGGYRFSDFLKVGLPLNVMMWATAMIVIPIFWPFVPV